MVDARCRELGLRREHAEVVARRTPRQERTCIEVGAHHPTGMRVITQGLAVEVGLSLSSVQAQHEAHGGGFAGAVRAQEARNDAVGDGEGQVIDGAQAAEGLADVLNDDGHGSDPTRAPTSLPAVIPRDCSATTQRTDELALLYDEC